MNRVKAGDAWARVSTKRYGFRLDGNEARIEILSRSFSRRYVVSISLLVCVPAVLSLFCSTSLYASPRSHEPSLYYRRVVCSV